jgi:hypothetical protein
MKAIAASLLTKSLSLLRNRKSGARSQKPGARSQEQIQRKGAKAQRGKGAKRETLRDPMSYLPSFLRRSLGCGSGTSLWTGICWNFTERMDAFLVNSFLSANLSCAGLLIEGSQQHAARRYKFASCCSLVSLLSQTD